MRRWPSGSSEHHDALTLRVSPAAHVYDNKGPDQPRDIASDSGDAKPAPAPKQEPAIDDAQGRRPTRLPQSYRTTSGAAATPPPPPPPAASDDNDNKDPPMHPPAKDITPDSIVERHGRRRSRLRSPWSCSLYTLAVALLGFTVLFAMLHSSVTRQLDTKGCDMCYMRPFFVKCADFDTEHTRFASKYSLHLYREGGIDDDVRVRLRYPQSVQSG